ncbi:MAG: hypothetical protein BWY15_00018 [Firmicutes bacterium ADurb.Bin193]|nr:MAG: hypothetical protein BWY15_00018 [Firmicutes bacterium ADurb.Bin193]
MWILGVLVIIALVLACFFKSQPSESEVKKDITYPYKRKFLFTKPEYSFYWKLKEYADKYGMIIFPKIRMADIVESTLKDRSEWQSAFNKINSKHVDFVLCDGNLHIKTIIELDDYTHERQNRKERDAFVDKAFESAGIRIVHIKGSYDNLESILGNNDMQTQENQQ